MRRLGTMCAFAVLTACGGTTGSGISAFSATASGPADVTAGSLAFTNDKQADVVLTRAYLHVGAVYLNEVVPDTGSGVQPCIASGTYVGEVFGGIDVDLLSALPQDFPNRGEGTENRARTAEVWLTGGDVNATDDSTVIFDVAGTATQGGTSYDFTGAVTIGENRAITPTDSAEPGSNPICLQRIVTPIDVDMVLTDGGTLTLQIDPRAIFADVDFSDLVASSDGSSMYVIPDTNTGIGAAVFRGLQRDSGVYSFTYQNGEQ